MTRAGEFEQRLAFRLRAGAELQADGVLEEQQQRNLALLDKFLAVGLAKAGGDVPVDVADVVAVGVLDDLVELHAAAAERRAVLAAEHVLDRMTHAPLELAQKRKLGGDEGSAFLDGGHGMAEGLKG